MLEAIQNCLHLSCMRQSVTSCWVFVNRCRENLHGLTTKGFGEACTFFLSIVCFLLEKLRDESTLLLPPPPFYETLCEKCRQFWTALIWYDLILYKLYYLRQRMQMSRARSIRRMAPPAIPRIIPTSSTSAAWVPAMDIPHVVSQVLLAIWCLAPSKGKLQYKNVQLATKLAPLPMKR